MGQVGPVWVGPVWAGRPSLARPSLGRPSLGAIRQEGVNLRGMIYGAKPVLSSYMSLLEN